MSDAAQPLQLVRDGRPVWSEPAWRQAVRDGRVIAAHTLTGAEAKVLLAYREHADRQGQAWCGQPALQRATGLSRDGVRKAVKGLLRKGVLVEVHAGGAGPGRTRTVALHVPPPPTHSPPPPPTQANASGPSRSGTQANASVTGPATAAGGGISWGDGCHPIENKGLISARLRGDKPPGKGCHLSPQRVHEGDKKEGLLAAAQQPRASAEWHAAPPPPLFAAPAAGQPAAAKRLVSLFHLDGRQAAGLVHHHRVSLREVWTVWLNIQAMRRDSRATTVNSPAGFVLAAIRAKASVPITLDPRVHEMRQRRQKARRKRMSAGCVTAAADVSPLTAAERKAAVAAMRAAVMRGGGG